MSKTLFLFLHSLHTKVYWLSPVPLFGPRSQSWRACERRSWSIDGEAAWDRLRRQTFDTPVSARSSPRVTSGCSRGTGYRSFAQRCGPPRASSMAPPRFPSPLLPEQCGSLQAHARRGAYLRMRRQRPSRAGTDQTDQLAAKGEGLFALSHYRQSCNSWAQHPLLSVQLAVGMRMA